MIPGVTQINLEVYLVGLEYNSSNREVISRTCHKKLDRRRVGNNENTDLEAF